MTKSWEDIRQEACRLYVGGQTLSQVQAQIEAKYNFKASTRSYRNHFKQWGITRSAQLESLKKHTTASPLLRVEENGVYSGHGGLDRFDRSHSMTVEMSPMDASTEHMQVKFRDLQTHTLPKNADSFWSTESVLTLQSVYGEIRLAAEFQRRQILQTQVFADGHDNVLHYVVTTEDYCTLNYVVDFMRTEKGTVDIVSSRKRTALEIAIYMEKQVVVRTLLEAKASLVKENAEGQHPLLFAISVVANTDICRLLLDYGASANETLHPITRQPITPMGIAMDQFLHSTTERQRNTMCAVLQELINHGAPVNLKGTPSEPIMRFIKAAAELEATSPSVRQKQTLPSSLLGYYLSADRNPLCWFPKYHCPAFECRSLAAFIISHTPKSGLSAILIESSDVTKYGLELVWVVLTPCRMRYSSVQDLSINDLLSVLLRRMQEHRVSGHLRTGLLRHIIEHTPRKKRLECLQVLIPSGYVDTQDCLEALSWINDVEDTNFRLAFAELLLTQISSTMDGVYSNLDEYFFHNRASQLRDLKEDVDLHNRMREQILPKLDIHSNQQNEDCLVQAVIHSFTKLLLEGKSKSRIISASNVLYVACALRLRYQLPDVPISKSLLLELQNATKQQNKHFSNVFRSEINGSIRSPTSAEPDYPTPTS